MKTRPAFDLRLFLVCTGVTAGPFAVLGTLALMLGLGWVIPAVVAYGLGLSLGLGLYEGLRRAGYGWNRPPDQAEAYGD